MTQSFGGNPTIEQIASSFFDQSEAQAFYQNMTTTSALVTAAYQNLFNRAPDTDGLAYWIGEIDGGRISQSNMLLALVNGALDNSNGNDVTIMAHKTTVGLAFANTGLNNTSLATSVMSGVTDSFDTVTSALTTITDNLPASATSTVTGYNFQYQFTSAELAGHTYYEVYASADENGSHTWNPNVAASASTLDSIRTITFNANGTATESDTQYPGETLTVQWNVRDDGVVTFMIPDGNMYDMAIAKSTSQDLILIDSADYVNNLRDFAGDYPDTWGYSYMTTNSTLAHSLLGQPSVLNAETIYYDYSPAGNTLYDDKYVTYTDAYGNEEYLMDANGNYVYTYDSTQPLYSYNGHAIIDPEFTDQVWLNIA